MYEDSNDISAFISQFQSLELVCLVSNRELSVVTHKSCSHQKCSDSKLGTHKKKSVNAFSTWH